MINDPLISFCMSTYKRPAILKVQLLQILQQAYTNYEVVVSDNDEAASGKVVVEEIGDDRIKYFHNPVNLGMVKSFNKSVERSKGDFVVMVTDDDPVYPNMLQTLMSLYSEYPEFGVYAGCGDIIVNNDFTKRALGREIGANSTLLKTLEKNQILKLNSEQFLNKYFNGFFDQTYLLWSCCMIKREIVLLTGGMPDYGSELLADFAYIITNSSQQGMLFTNQAFGGQEVRGDNFSFVFDALSDKYRKTPILFFNYLKEKIGDHPRWPSLEAKVWQFLGRIWVEYSMMIFKSLKVQKKPTSEFLKQLNISFSSTQLRKWRLKFYLKTFARPIFNLVLKLRS